MRHLNQVTMLFDFPSYEKKGYLEEIYGAEIEEEYRHPIAITKPSIAAPTNPTATAIDMQQLVQHLSLLLQQPPPQNGNGLLNPQGENGAATDSSTNDIGVSAPSLYPEAERKAKELLQYVAAKKGGYPDDKYTILHFSFKNGQPKRCLLYTSPSPRDATLSRMPSSA